jgi:O-antigen/teichoic acid export membrane protein
MNIPNILKKDLNLKEIFRGGSIALVFKVVAIFMGYVFFLIISRQYGAEKQGVFSLCWTLMMFGAVVGRLGLDTAIVRLLAADISNTHGQHARILYRRALLIVILASGLVSLIFFIISPYLSSLFFDSKAHTQLIRIIGFAVIPMSVMSYNAEAMRGHKKIGLYSIFQNGSIYIIILGLLLIVSFRNNELSFLIQSIIIALIIMAFLSFILYFNSERKLPNITDNKQSASVKAILIISLPMLFTNSLFLIMNWTDIFMLGIYRPESDVGIYNIAVKIAALNSIVLAAVNSIAAPKFAEIHARSDKKALRKLAKQTTLLNTVLSLPIFILILIIPGFLMKLFGADFEFGVQALLILACGQIFNAVSGSKMYILNMTGYEKTGRNIILTGAIANVILNAILIPRYGINGGAIATFSSTLFWNILGVFYIYKYHGFLTYPINFRKDEGY